LSIKIVNERAEKEEVYVNLLQPYPWVYNPIKNIGYNIDNDKEGG
jgi:hypothetical protein